MTAAELAEHAELRSAADKRTLEILEHRRRKGGARRRGWVVRRALAAADLIGLVGAFLVAETVIGADSANGNVVDRLNEAALFALTLPAWLVVAKLYGLYDHDEERANHSTVDDFKGVFHLVTVGAWLVFAGARLGGVAEPDLLKIGLFWGSAIVAISACRAVARAYCHRTLSYLQNAVILGEGEVGQLVARKLIQHPEYGVNLVGFVDFEESERPADLGHVAHLGPPDRLSELVTALDVERVIVAFAEGAYGERLATIRSLNDRGVQIDVVPQLFEVMGPNVDLHAVEGVSLVGLRPVRLSRSSRLLKRVMDLVGAGALLLFAAPLFAIVAWRIKRDSPGPVFFRQTRVGLNQREFTMLKFRTMKVDTRDARRRACPPSSSGT